MSDLARIPDPAAAKPKQRKSMGCFFNSVFLLGIFVILFHFALGPVGHGTGFRYKISRIQQCRQIGQLLFAYAVDNTENGNAYPGGNSSTEIFQILIDKGYVTDPRLFYIPLAGKIEPVPGQKLKSENVCWDVTSGVGAHAPKGLPLVFMTGYKITYTPGSGAVPIIKPYPPYCHASWLESVLVPNTMDETSPVPGIAVFYAENDAKFIKLDPVKNPDGTTTYPATYKPDGAIPNFVPPDFQPDGHTYRQLTPEGELK